MKIISSSSTTDSAQYDFKADGSYTITDYYYHPKPRPLAVLAGGLLSSYSPPVAAGEIIIRGLLVSPLQNWAGSGIFCANQNYYTIEPSGAGSTENNADCIQSRPLLVQDVRFGPGHSPSRGGPPTYDYGKQSFVCITNDGKLMLGVSSPIRLDLLAEDLRKILNCRDALSMTNHETAALYYGDHLVGSDSLPLTSVIAVFKKQ